MKGHFLISSRYDEQLKNRARKYFEVKFKTPISDESIEAYLESLGKLFLAFSPSLEEKKSLPPLAGEISSDLISPHSCKTHI